MEKQTSSCVPQPEFSYFRVRGRDTEAVDPARLPAQVAGRWGLKTGPFLVPINSINGMNW
jgi:hypothetical protein